ncbi:hypothetical protein PIB30_035154 [Stylosanthes scabra]|uniref:Uncharacterized protein n=1 Tax=Stylosanthes scabra TaxID=79078 RepID=A0ABU6WF15_9FABA|nr:hypothetical protein [Stylosanthes scabra]
MVSFSPFKSLDHAITVARDIFLNQLDVSCWVEALSSRDCFDQYLADAKETTVQELHEWGSKYDEKFGENASIGTDVIRPFETAYYQEKEGDDMDRQHMTYESNIAHRNFDLNKKPWYGHDISDPVKRDSFRFLTEIFSPGEYDTSERN